MLGRGWGWRGGGGGDIRKQSVVHVLLQCVLQTKGMLNSLKPTLKGKENTKERAVTTKEVKQEEIGAQQSS